jgi:hypothetical protein
MARVMWDTTEIYRAVVRHWCVWSKTDERVSHYGPYEGPSGRGQAKRRLKDQHEDVIEGKVQKLVAVYRVNEPPTLEWVDIDG